MEQIQTLHKGGFAGLYALLKRRGTLVKLQFWLALGAAILLSLFCLCFAPEKSLQILVSIVKKSTALFPNLLGFSLGGFAIVVGFTNTDLIKEAARKNKDSIYQLLNGFFALCILLQVLVVLLSFFVDWCLEVGVDKITPINTQLASFVNSILVFLLSFGAIYSLLLTPYIVVNLFTISQLNNFFYTFLKFFKDEKAKSGCSEEK